MIQFPVLTRLEVRGYGLYPGRGPEHEGLDATFLPGLNLVLGANGLGKSTLVAMLFRMLSGYADVRGLGAWQMGSGQLEVKPLLTWDVKTFADRVGDAARDATATLEFAVGETHIRASRSLNSLTLLELVVDDVELEPDESEFQKAVVDAADIDSFLSWLLILRYLVFYSDERRSLVWDATAQRRLLPLLFLTPKETRPLEELERQILSLDSTVRNLGAALTKQEKELKNQELALSSQPAVQAELEELIERRSRAEQALEELQDASVAAEEERGRARLEALRAEDRLQSARTQLEERRLREVQRALPTIEESTAYIVAHLVSDEICLVCGAHAPEHAAELIERIENHMCSICGSPLTSPQKSSDDAAARIEDVREEFEAIRAQADDAAMRRRKAEGRYTEILAKIAEADQEVTTVGAQISQLERSLPESDRSISKRREGIAELRAGNNQMREQVLEMKDQLAYMTDEQNRRLSQHKDEIKLAFERHAEGFLLEQCSLVWGSNIEKIGQLGPGIEFSVFHVDMSGGARSDMSRRDGEKEVSESQREFIDLAFRMALVSVAGADGVGSLVVDAPESSLDAVFAPRAADVLTRFGRGDERSRVVITSNLVDGQLIPKLAEQAGITSLEDDRIINLFEIAASTAAIRERRAEYDAALRRVFNAPGSGSSDE